MQELYCTTWINPIAWFFLSYNLKQQSYQKCVFHWTICFCLQRLNKQRETNLSSNGTDSTVTQGNSCYNFPCNATGRQIALRYYMWLYLPFPFFKWTILSLLKSSASKRGLPKKFWISFWQLCDIFLTTFWWLSFELANQNAWTGGNGVVKRHVGFPTNDNSASHCLAFWLARCNKKPSESCRKDVKRLSKTNQKLSSGDHG